MKEWVAFELNKTEASNPSIAIVPITTSYSPFVVSWNKRVDLC